MLASEAPRAAIVPLILALIGFLGVGLLGLPLSGGGAWTASLPHPSRPKVPFRLQFAPLRQMGPPTWDVEHLLDTPEKRERAFRAAFSNADKASLARLRRKIKGAIQNNRTLIIGSSGGSFSIGSAAFPSRLAKLLNAKKGFGLAQSEGGPGAGLISIAQGSSTFALPLYCGPVVYALGASGSEGGPSERELAPPTPDVWIIDFLANWPNDKHAGDHFAGYLAANLHDPERSGSGDNAAAVINTAVALKGALADVATGAAFPMIRNWARVYRIQKKVSDKLGIPMISFVHGLLGSLEDPTFFKTGKPSTSAKEMVKLTRKLYQADGMNIHYDDYAHRFHAELIWELFRFAATTEDSPDDPPELDLNATLASIPDKSTRSTISRIVGSPDQPKTLTCITLLNHGGKAITPLSMKNYELQSHKMEGNRRDVKRTFVPLALDAELVLSVRINKGARTACPIVYGLRNETVHVSFPGYDTPSCFVSGWHTHVWGKSVPLYAAKCGCAIPEDLADGREHGVRLTPGKGFVQIAGIAVY